MKYVHYLPMLLDTGSDARKEMQTFGQFFKLVNANACMIDRTGTIQMPFDTHVLYPIPEQTDDVADFGYLCDARANEILDENKKVYFMYSGGLDSTCMLLAFTKAIRRRGMQAQDQVVIATSQDAVAENPWAWREIVRPKYKLMQARDMLANVDLSSNRYVQGENADQLFGSDLVFANPRFMTQAYSADALRQWLRDREVDGLAFDKFMTEFQALAAKCPLPVLTMRDFTWWLNFTCKWQNVALRTLMFSNVVDGHIDLDVKSLKAFDSFFNTVEFQKLSISGKLDRWSANPSVYTYKQAARDYILKETGWVDYVNTKMKVGSLYNVVRQRSFGASALAYDEELNSVFTAPLPE